MSNIKPKFNSTTKTGPNSWKRGEGSLRLETLKNFMAQRGVVSSDTVGGLHVRKALGWSNMDDEAESAGIIDIAFDGDAEQSAMLLLRQFEKSIAAVGRKDIDLLHIGVRESSSLLGKFISLCPFDGWKTGSGRLRSLVGRAKPGVGHLLFVLIAAPGNGTISYELKKGFRFNLLFFCLVLPFDFVWSFIAGFLRIGEAQTSNLPYERYKMFLERQYERTLERQPAYNPLILNALDHAIRSVEVQAPSPLPVSLPSAGGEAKAHGGRRRSRD